MKIISIFYFKNKIKYNLFYKFINLYYNYKVTYNKDFFLILLEFIYKNLFCL